MRERIFGSLVLCALLFGGGSGWAQERGFELGLELAAGGGFDINGVFTVGDSLGVGLLSPARQIHLQGRNAVFRMDRDVNSSAFLLVRTAPGDFSSIWKTYSIGVAAFGPGNGSFEIRDLSTAVGGGGVPVMSIDQNRNFGINTATPGATLDVYGSGSSFVLGLRRQNGLPVLAVGNGGAITFGDDSGGQSPLAGVLARGRNAPSGIDLQQQSVILGNEPGGVVPSFLALNGSAVLSTPGTNSGLGLLSVFDQDDLIASPAAEPAFRLTKRELRINGDGNSSLRFNGKGSTVFDAALVSTDGESMLFVTDSDASDGGVTNAPYTWFNEGTGGPEVLMALFENGGLALRGAVSENNAFDLAESFYKGGRTIEPGDVVTVDPDSAIAVELARSDADRSVIGVVSTAPGFILGGGAFSASELEEVWGAEMAGRYLDQRAALEAAVLERSPDLASGLERIRLALIDPGGVAPAGASRAETERVASEAMVLERQASRILEQEGLRLFFERNFARVALAGRVPVKVDASYGAIERGDLLVASSTPGHARRTDDPAPGTVLGKALESREAGTGVILMLVMPR